MMFQRIGQVFREEGISRVRPDSNSINDVARHNSMSSVVKLTIVVCEIKVMGLYFLEKVHSVPSVSGKMGAFWGRKVDSKSIKIDTIPYYQ